MSDDGLRAGKASGARSDGPARVSGDPDARPMSFECCFANSGGAMSSHSCSAVVRRHPVIATASLVLMGLALLVIPAGAILGIIAFFRTM